MKEGAVNFRKKKRQWNPSFIALVITCACCMSASAQTPDELIATVKAKLDKVNNYEARGKMRTNVVFIKAPIATVRVYYKKPDKLRIKNESGISFIPKGTMNINVSSLFLETSKFDVIDAGKEASTQFRILKLLPKEDNSDVVLSTLYIDEKLSLVRKSKTTTRENGTYELEMNYGKYGEYGLADKIIFSFNTKEYKLPKGVTFDYDDGSKKPDASKVKDKKGRVEITYSSYIINKGVAEEVFK